MNAEEKKLSVLMVSQTFYPLIGGSEKQSLELSRALISMGHSVMVVTRRLASTSASEIISGVPVTRLGRPGSGLMDSVIFMLKVFSYLIRNKESYDAVHVHLASSPAVAAVVAGAITGKRTVVKLGGGLGVDEITLSSKTFLGRIKLAFFSFWGPELLVMNSEVYNWLKGQKEFSKMRLRLFRNGVDTGRYTPPLYGEKMAAKAALGLSGEMVFLFVGRLSPEKRIKEFAELWAEIFSEEMVKPKMRLVIVGKGPERDSLEKAAKDLGVSGSIVLAGAKDDLLPYYRAADVFILPSISEGLSNSMLEAMSCGVAVMASRVGGAKEAVVEGESGLLFEPMSRQEIKNCIKKFIADGNLAVKFGESARRRVVEKYAMSKVAEDLVRIYSEKGE